jgi:putative PEP-CTERM system TPR-repeat lipoprotein
MKLVSWLRLLNIVKLLLVCSVIIHSSFALAQSTSQDYEKALKSFEELDYPSAVIHLKNVFKSNPDYLPGRILYAEMMLNFNNGVSAEMELRRAKDLGGDLNIINPLLAQALLFQQKFSEVLSISIPAQSSKSIESDMAYFKGQAYLGLKKFVPAEESFAQALNLKSTNAKAMVGKAQVFMAYKLYDKAQIQVDHALQAHNIPENAWVLKAKLLQLNGELVSATKLLDKGIKKLPTKLSLRFTLAEILLAQGKGEEAEAQINFILDQAPKEPQVNFLKAVIESKRGQHDKVDVTINHILNTLLALSDEVIDDNPRYSYLAGYLNYKQRKYEAASVHLKKYLANNPDLRTYLLLAKTEMALTEYTSAIRTLQKVDRETPNQADVLALLGESHYKSDNQIEAQSYLLKSLKINSNSPDVLLILSKSYMEEEQYFTAMDILTRIEQAYPNSPNVLLLKNKCLISLNNYQQAIYKTQTLIANYPNNAGFHVLHGQNLIKIKQFDQAEKSFQQALIVEPNSLAALLSRIDILVAKKLLDEALNETIELAKVHINKVEVLLKLVHIYKQLGNQEQVILWLEKSLALDVKSAATLNILERTYRRTGNLDKLKKILETNIQSKPIEEEYRILASIYLSQRQYGNAISSYQKYVDISKNKGRALIALANAYTITKNYPEAITSMKKALVWQNGLVEANVALVKLLLLTQDFKQAQLVINDIRKKSEPLSIADLLQGDLYFKQQKYKTALSSYLKAHKTYATDQSTLSLYRTYKKLSRYEDAQKLLTPWVNQNKHSDLKPLIALADIYKILHLNDLIIPLYKNGLLKHPNSPLLMNNIANAYTLNNNLIKAVEFAEKALIIAPNNVIIMDTLAWNYSLSGDDEKALALYRKALSIEFNNNTIKYHMAISLERLGRKNAALKMLIEAVESSRPFAENAQAKHLLSQWLKS